ncbi:MAG: hypothetical protein A2998_01490 [Candidatus Staskawiczbacteria bacterium RIFCSPLOWO2_01_FULL_37_25b]|uniref:Uncharacterized protein n=1 Tax=Candidatus Staskawiczbacteria bacterium RIFCSPLOWO2_01_FULL_37_25b TaxID=1802213 RepID=A0A1G2IHF4_9BACT|nr:MAG: hypothetical protein A2998_01490 [Candidatus Staskawiczbacteria bacterium RIFCSPLOWO2_01_FULL_37_25b]
MLIKFFEKSCTRLRRAQEKSRFSFKIGSRIINYCPPDRKCQIFRVGNIVRLAKNEAKKSIKYGNYKTT